MYVFGGWNGKDFFNDVITFDLEKLVWSKLQTSGKFLKLNKIGTPPCPRKGHASYVVGHNLIIQGGLYFEEEQYRKKISTYGTYLKVLIILIEELLSKRHKIIGYENKRMGTAKNKWATSTTKIWPHSLFRKRPSYYFWRMVLHIGKKI